MPCSDGRDFGRTEYIYQDNPETKQRLDYVTQLLCGLCRFLSGQEIFKHYLRQTPALATWWKEHQEYDRMREEKERRKAEKARLKKEALAKLSAAERKALGL